MGRVGEYDPQAAVKTRNCSSAAGILEQSSCGSCSDAPRFLQGRLKFNRFRADNPFPDSNSIAVRTLAQKPTPGTALPSFTGAAQSALWLMDQGQAALPVSMAMVFD